jgi:hypothetical protein
MNRILNFLKQNFSGIKYLKCTTIAAFIILFFLQPTVSCDDILKPEVVTNVETITIKYNFPRVAGPLTFLGSAALFLEPIADASMILVGLELAYIQTQASPEQVSASIEATIQFYETVLDPGVEAYTKKTVYSVC